MKTQITASALFTLLLMFLSLESCKEQLQDVKSNTVSQVGTGRTKEIHPLEAKAPTFYEKIDSPYEDYGELVYYHFKFNPVSDPIKYLPESKRGSFTQALERITADNEGLSIDQRLEKMKKAGMIDDNISSLYSTFFQNISRDFETIKSSEEAWSILRSYEKGLISKANTDGVGSLLVFSSMFRNYIKYKWEVNEFTTRAISSNSSLKNARAAGCFLGITTQCWGQALGQAFIDGLAAGIVGGISAGSDKTFWQGLSNAGLTSAGTNFIKGVFSAYNNSTCGCGYTAPSCEYPSGFRIIIDNCGLTQQFQVIGGGTSATNFNYSVQNGSFPEFGNSSSVQNTGAKLIKVTQTNPNTPIYLTASVVCSTGQIFAYSNSFDLYALTRDPEPIGISGAVNVNYNDPSNWDYVLINNGPVANKNNTYIWSRNFAGQTVAGGANNDNYIRIKWTARTNMAKVFLQSLNQCSNTQAYRDLSVNVY